MKLFKKINLRTFTDRGFNLTPVELDQVVPFEVKRLYYFDDIPAGSQTGEHCHKIEDEVFFQVKGSCTAIIDQGKGKEDIRLEGPGDAIYTPAYVWHGFKDASPDCVILAVSSTHYSPDRSDYVEDYDLFLKLREEKNGKLIV